jgi:hypothetical protein
MSGPWGILIACLVVLTAGVWAVARSRNMHYWLPAYLAQMVSRGVWARPTVRHVYFCFADHYEPYGGTQDRERAHRRVKRWVDEYPVIAARHRDSDGNPPTHSYFYPIEEYDAELLDELAGLTRSGLGDVEVHLHHDNDNADNLRTTLEQFVQTLHERHGLLRRDPKTGRPVYCFIHGNWALDNSRPDGRWCGVDNELDILVNTGCRADMTMPSAPSDTQTRKINSIYFAKGHPGCRKSHDTGRDVGVGRWGKPEELLMVQGPLALNWKDAKFGVVPRIESAELSYDARPTAHRVALWGQCGVSVRGAEGHIFIKVHTHGATERSMEMLFGPQGFELLWTELERQYRDSPGSQLHYVTAWQMVEKIRELACEPDQQQVG